MRALIEAQLFHNSRYLPFTILKLQFYISIELLIQKHPLLQCKPSI